ncbi:MAG: MoxR family ATPase [Ilumatobacter sp.]|uniref:AAA family ATPase n=1 Tax=Ilumatobacter sp. TaxID=1967498 RepID=UPI0026326B09|nr:MoxR family ATPase [Ilumatobacter sp.]MDJ0769160.1 MoxR family ATPase [Ilumatobacter sp.]
MTGVDSEATLGVDDAAAHAQGILDEIERAVVGKRPVLETILAAFLAGGHVLLDDVPGVAKTLSARSLAAVTGLSFSRVQFTPDVLPADITGSMIVDLATRLPTFRRGPLFAEIVLADEVNRAPAKTQSALLEAMQEAQVTADGEPHPLPHPFFVIATENPVESEGTYPLPEAQLDRFAIRTSIGYPDAEAESEIVRRRLGREGDRIDLRAVSSAEELLAVRRVVEHTHVEPIVADYAVEVVRATRRHRDLTLGASPRGSLAIVNLARATAVIAGRDFVTPDDVRAVAVPCLAHRVVSSDQAWARGLRNEEIVQAVVDSVPAPSWE